MCTLGRSLSSSSKPLEEATKLRRGVIAIYLTVMWLMKWKYTIFPEDGLVNLNVPADYLDGAFGDEHSMNGD